MGGSKAEVDLVRDALRGLIDLSGRTRREVERQLAVEGGGVDLTRLLGGKLDPKLRHVLDICRVIDLHPLEFFRLVFKEPEQPSSLLQRLEALFSPGRPPAITLTPRVQAANEDLGALLERHVAALVRLVEALNAERQAKAARHPEESSRRQR
jgi:hypothetical protein